MSTRIKVDPIHGIKGRLGIERLEDRWVPSTIVTQRGLVAEMTPVAASLVDSDTPALSRPASRPSEQIEIVSSPVENSVVDFRPERPTANIADATDPIDVSVVFTTRPAPAVTDASTLVLPTTNTPNDGGALSGREIVGAILQRHPEWQVDTEWVNSGNFTLGEFGDWYFNQDGSGETPSDNPSTEQRPGSGPKETVDHSVTTPEHVVVRPSHSSTSEATTEIHTANANSIHARPEPTHDSGTPAASAHNPVLVAWADARVVESRSASANNDHRGETQPSNTDGVFAGNRADSVIARSAVSAGLTSDVTPADESASAYHVTALVFATHEAAADETQSSFSAFVPHTAGLHTALSAFEMPVFDLGAWGEQVVDFVSNLTVSETTVIVTSCVVVLLAAGVGGEMLRRHYRRAMSQLVSNAPGSIILDLSLIG